MKNEHPISVTKLIIYTIMPLQRPIIGFLLIFAGIYVGITLRSHLKDFSFTYSLDPQLSLLNPLPITSLWSPTQESIDGINESDEDDQDLINRVLKMDPPAIRGSTPAGKVAFLFLTKGSLPLAPLWEKFFEKHKGSYSVYVHTHPHYNWTLPKHSAFYGSIIPSKLVGWGKFNMMEAERRLLANALLEPTNQRFVLLSESCIPLFNFPTIYSYLMGTTLNFVEAYNEPGLSGIGRYKTSFMPLVLPSQWLKGSQWFTINRDLATSIVLDSEYFPRFKKVCGSSTCHADEHYLPTFVNIKFARKNANRSLTWVNWSGGGMHPKPFYRGHITVEFLEGLRNERSSECDEEKRAICFLFGRKFMHHGLSRLIRFVPKVMKF